MKEERLRVLADRLRAHRKRRGANSREIMQANADAIELADEFLRLLDLFDRIHAGLEGAFVSIGVDVEETDAVAIDRNMVAAIERFAELFPEPAKPGPLDAFLRKGGP